MATRIDPAVAASPVKMDSDAFYESITVRIFAQGRDHTIDDNGRVVAGSNVVLRQWSEYWTSIRLQRLTRPRTLSTGLRPNSNRSAALSM